MLLQYILPATGHCIADSDRRLLKRILLCSARRISGHFEIAVTQISCIFMHAAPSTVIVRISRRVYAPICISAVPPIGTLVPERKEGQENEGEAKRACLSSKLHRSAATGRTVPRPLDGEQIATVSAPGSSRPFLSGFRERNVVSVSQRTRGDRPTTRSRSSYFWRWFSFCQDDG